MDQQNDYTIEIQEAIRQRYEEFNKNCPQQLLIELQSEIKEFEKANNNLLNILDPIKQRFESNMMVACTRIFEYYNLDSQDKRRFQFQLMIQGELREWKHAFQQAHFDYKIYEYQDQEVIRNAFNNFRNNHKILELIIDRKLTSDEIDQFLKSQKIYIYVKQISTTGISSVDGQTIYIGSFTLQLSLKKYVQEVLEHELAHNLVRFFMTKKNIRMISPEKNKNLRIEGYMIEGGKFYDIRAGYSTVTQDELKYQDPFTFLKRRK